MRCMQRTNIYLEAEQCDALDELARARGVTRSEVIRQLIDQGLGHAGSDLAADLAAIEASFGVLAEEDHWESVRGPDERSRHLDEGWRSS